MIGSITLVPILVALVEVIKKIGLPGKFCPVVAMVLGVGINLYFGMLGEGLNQQILFGIAAGLASSGLFDLGAKTILAKKAK